MLAQNIRFAEIISYSDIDDVAHAVLSELFACEGNADELRMDKWVSIEQVILSFEKNLGDAIGCGAKDAIAFCH